MDIKEIQQRKEEYINEIKKIWEKGVDNLLDKDSEKIIKIVQSFIYFCKNPNNLNIHVDNKIEVLNRVNLSFYLGNKYDDSIFNSKQFAEYIEKKIKDYLKIRDDLFLKQDKTKIDKKQIIKFHRLVYPDFNSIEPFNAESYDEIKREVIETFINKSLLKLYLKGYF